MIKWTKKDAMEHIVQLKSPFEVQPDNGSKLRDKLKQTAETWKAGGAKSGLQ